MGRHADPEPLRQGERPPHAVEGHGGLDRRADPGEAARSRGQSADPQKIEAFIRADDFSIAAFKGQKLTLPQWNWQLRQPIFLGDSKSVVSTSPQEGFLHQVSELDTLGVDQPETKCVLN